MRKKRVFILICTICIFLFLIIWIVESIHISKLVEQTFAMAYESDGQYEMSKYPVIFDENKLDSINYRRGFYYNDNVISEKTQRTFPVTIHLFFSATTTFQYDYCATYPDNVEVGGSRVTVKLNLRFYNGKWHITNFILPNN